MEQHLVPVLTAAIDAVANDRRAQSLRPRMGGVDTELVGPTGKRGKLYAGRGLVCRQLLPPGDADFTMHRIVYLPGAVVRVETKGQVNFPAGFCNAAENNSDIFFVDRPFFKLSGEKSMGCGGHGENHQAGGVHVQSVHCRLVDHLRKMTAQSGCGTVLFLRTSSGHGEQSPRFIDDDDLTVVVENFHIRLSVHLLFTY